MNFRYSYRKAMHDVCIGTAAAAAAAVIRRCKV